MGSGVRDGQGEALMLDILVPDTATIQLERGPANTADRLRCYQSEASEC